MGSSRGSCPQVHMAPQPSQGPTLPSCMPAQATLLFLTHSGTPAQNGSVSGLPLFFQVRHLFEAHLCLLGSRSGARFEQRGSAGFLGISSGHSSTSKASGREGLAERLRAFENKVTSRQPKSSQAPSIKFLTRKIVCPFLCNTPLGFFIMTSFPLVILERLYNCKSVIESNRISFGARNAPCHGRSFGVK